MAFYCNGKKGVCYCDILCADCIYYDDSGGKQVQTNADRIRTMSDEELAKVLNAFTEYFEECNRSISDVECKDCELYQLCCLGEGNALEWLKQPAEEGADNE